jgi:ElaB/YqjD/DUF883 family membrane-anchored ribosome-binding protein
MTEKDHVERGEEPPGQQSPGTAALSAAAKHAHQVMDSARDAMQSAKEAAAGANLDEVGARAAATASNLYREGRELLSGNEDLSRAVDNLGAAIRKNPLAAVGIAFSAGLLLALLVRG